METEERQSSGAAEQNHRGERTRRAEGSRVGGGRGGRRGAVLEGTEAWLTWIGA